MLDATAIHRRQFLRTAALSAGGLTILRSPKSAHACHANDRLRLAIFGSMYNAEHFFTSAHQYNASIVALCNPDRRKLPGIFQKFKQAAEKMAAANNSDAARDYDRLATAGGVPFFQDVRQLFDRLHNQFDALVVSDYDHFHGVACGLAMRAGKPVCSERPLGLKISDARRLRELAAQTSVPTVYRSPGTATGSFRRALELVAGGALGSIREAHIWFKRGGPDRKSLPVGKQPVPEGLDWDLWLGPLAWRDYHPDWLQYAHWRETSNGGLGSFGPHTSIFPFLALDVGSLWDDPQSRIRVHAECSSSNALSFPRWERVHWQIPARKTLPPVTIHWHHGPEFAPGTRELIHGKMSAFGIASAAEADGLMKTAGTMLIGASGALVGDDHSVSIKHFPASAFASSNLSRPERTAASSGLYRDWIDACRGQKSNVLATFETGGRLSELLMLGNIATQFPGETLEYVPTSGQIANHPEASRLLTFNYRPGWSL
jgi:hypothetical protein